MWGAFLKIFKASPTNTSFQEESEKENQSNESDMSHNRNPEPTAEDVPEIRPLAEYEGNKAKQRASILWLVAKANDHTIPDDLKEPYYKDHENQDQLKPVIVHALASAEYYCLALGVIYADPNYHRLNHWGVIQALARKGIYVNEPSDVALTETVLIQTSPIRMSAHMAVIEAIMALYIKETITTDRIVQVVKRFSSFSPSTDLPSDPEEGLILWINKICVKMKHRIEEELNANDPDIQLDGLYLDRVPPAIPVLHDLEDLSNGCCLATVISFYCPSAFLWQDICYNVSLNMTDSLYNLQLVQKFCEDFMPSNPCVLSLEDLIYFHSSIRQNIVAFLADLFFLFELKPAKCVTSPGATHEVDATEAHVPQNGRGFHPISPAGRRSFQQAVSPIPDLRSSSYSSMPDINRISPRSHSCPQTIKEPMFPRRQIVSHLDSRTLERPKRYSFHEAPRGHTASGGGHGRSISADGSGNSIRRTHSLLDINATALDRGVETGNRAKDYRRTNPRIETRSHGDADSEPEIYYVHHSLNLTPATRKSPEMNWKCANAGDEMHVGYSRISRKQDEEPLLPARLKPSKEKNNSDSKLEERGEHDKHHTYSQYGSAGQSRLKSTGSRHLPCDDKNERLSRPLGVEGDSVTDKQFSSVPKHLTKADELQVMVGDSLSGSEDYTLDNSKLTKPIRHKDFTSYEGYYDNKDLEEQLSAQNLGRTTLYVPQSDSNKTQYIIIATDKEKDEHNLMDNEKQALQTTSFAQLSNKLRDHHHGGGINIVYMQHDRDNNFDGNRHPLKSSFLQRKNSGEKKTTTFATLPNQTSWQHQGAGFTILSPGVDSGLETPESNNEMPLATELHNVRLKLEERRRRIESEKRKMELSLNRARQKVGKAAFLQAISKGKGSGRNTPDSGASGDLGSPTVAVEPHIPEDPAHPVNKDYTIQEIAEDLNTVQNKWFDSQISVDTLSGPDSERPSPDVEGVTFEEYTRSLDRLNTSLSDIQSDIQRLTNQQDHIQQVMRNGISHPPQEPPAQPKYYGANVSSQQWLPPSHHVPTEQDFLMGPSAQLPSGQRMTQWEMPIVSGTNTQVPVSLMQQHPGPYSYINEQGYIVQQQPQPTSSFNLHPQQPTSMASHSSENLPEQYTNYYSVNPYGKPMSYHQTIPPRHSVSHSTASIPFRLHTESPIVNQTQQQHQQQHHQSQQQQHHQSQQQHQPPKLYQRPSQSQTPPLPRPTTLQTSLPNKGFSVDVPSEVSMEPQMVHFIENQSPTREGISNISNSDLHKHFSTLDGVSGTATYRVKEPVSPTRPLLTKTFRVPKSKPVVSLPSQEFHTQGVDADDDSTSSDTSLNAQQRGADKGFFVSLDDDQPKRLKPPLRVRKVPRNAHRSQDSDNEVDGVSVPPAVRSSFVDRILYGREDANVSSKLEDDINKITIHTGSDINSPATRILVDSPAVGFTIEAKEEETDMGDDDEMAKKRERILLNALKRKEQLEVIKVKKEAEFAQRREQERMKQEMSERKREEERARRQAILEQYKQRKAMEEQENEKIDTTRTSTLPKTKTRTQKPRPKSLHESALASTDSDSSNLNLGSSGSRGSQISLTGLDRSTPPRRAPSPGHLYRHPLSPSSGPPSLPPGLVARRGGPISDTASDTCSTTSSTLEYTGPKLFKQPTAKSNRGIIINAINSVLAGAVNNDSKRRALEEIAQSDSKHFLILFRDSGCQFRALYSYSPEREEVCKLFGIGPSKVSEHMIDRYYKYNSGGKSFMEIQTKHLTVTIDAFTIHNTLWQGKKGAIPKKELY